MNMLFVARLLALPSVLLLASCAGTGTTTGPQSGRDVGYVGTPAQREAVRIAELFPRPPRVASVPGEAYRCVGERGTEYVKISGSEWYLKNENESTWLPVACNRGERNNGVTSIQSICGAGGVNAWAVSTDQGVTGSSIVHRMFSSDTKTLKTLVRQGDSDRTTYATCTKAQG